MEDRYSTDLTSANQTVELQTTFAPLYQPVVTAILILILSVLPLVCVIGNSLVIATVITVKSLRSKVSNKLIVSLSVSDLLVGVGVMPLAILYDVTGRWPLGPVACISWVTLDVILCTASILNLTAISIDKYLTITNGLGGSSVNNNTQIATYCAIAWGLSIIIGTTPLMVGWMPNYDNGVCMINQYLGYQSYATLAAFYIPLIIMIAIHVKVSLISNRAFKSIVKNSPSYIPVDTEPHTSVEVSSEASTPLNRDCSLAEIQLDTMKPDMTMNCESSNQAKPASKASLTPSSCRSAPGQMPRSKPHGHQPRKAVKTVGFIMGLFIACWLPFFILAVVRPICKEKCNIPHALSITLTWLGYINSCLNPPVYASLNRDFRTPMKEMLCCRCSNVQRSVRKQIFQHKYGA